MDHEEAGRLNPGQGRNSRCIYPSIRWELATGLPHQGTAQLDAMILAEQDGIDVAPVWNKSHREHTIVGSRPEDVRAEADAAVAARHWRSPYFVDADHIGLKTVDGFAAAQRFLHARRGRLHRQCPADRRLGRLRAASPEIPRPARYPRHRPPVGNHRRDDSRRGGNLLARGGRGRRDLSSRGRTQGHRRFCHRSVDGRNRPAANAGRTVVHSRRGGRSGHSGPNHRPALQRPIQQGGSNTWATSTDSPASSRTTWR